MTGGVFEVPLAHPSTFYWFPPEMPSAAPSVSFKVGAVSLSVALSSGAALNVTGIPDPQSLSVDVADASALSGLVGSWGRWWLSLGAVGRYPVQVTHYDAGRGVVRLAHALPADIPESTAGSLVHNVWHADVAAGALGAEVNRSGAYEVAYTVDVDPAGANLGAPSTRVERGAVRVVRAPFSTGLTPGGLVELFPQMAHALPQGSDSWGPLIAAVDMRSQVEVTLPAGRYPDQLAGAQYRRAHALCVAAHAASVGILPNVDPRELQEQAEEELSKMSQRPMWLDSDDDGEIDAAEVGALTPALVGLSLVDQTEQPEDVTALRVPTVNPFDR